MARLVTGSLGYLSCTLIHCLQCTSRAAGAVCVISELWATSSMLVHVLCKGGCDMRGFVLNLLLAQLPVMFLLRVVSAALALHSVQQLG